MEAGRELNALVAERLGCKTLQTQKRGLRCDCGDLAHIQPGSTYQWKEYSTSITAAWELVNWLLTHRIEFTLDVGRHRGTGAIFYACRVDDVNFVYEDTAPLAICLAFLKATEPA